jgi:penicillin-binding protein 1C
MSGTAKSKILRWVTIAGLGGAGLMALTIVSFLAFDRHYPPSLAGINQVSVEVLDRDGKLLRAFVTKQGRWRLRTRLEDIDSEFVKLLIAYEDKRFWFHAGVDPYAMFRAAGQFVVNGRIVSGASTITMQLARLLEPRKRRSLLSKIRQIILALQIERRLNKHQILQAYLTLAPYGGNLEGVRAASLAYFAKEPKGLTLSQSALLVALPQSPEQRRPDRFVKNAKQARDVVLKRVSKINVIVPSEVARATLKPVSGTRFSLPQFAPHLAQKALRLYPEKTQHKVTVKRKYQQSLEEVARVHARSIDEKVSVALILADAQTGEILAEVGSPDYLNGERAGWIDMTDAMRSPGSALKPFIYGLAFEEGLIKPETLIMDSPADFSGYRPQNFDLQYQGEVSIRQALQRSLNVPAVHLLEAVGPSRLLALFRRAGTRVEMPRSDQPGLAIALGGMGISLRGLTGLYSALANGGRKTPLTNGLEDEPVSPVANWSVLLQPDASWYVNDILMGARAPSNTKSLKIAYKTGTSYGYRDAWSIGYDGRHVLGVWVGRPDNGSVPGITGRLTAAPILFDAFAKSGIKIVPFKPAPVGITRTVNQNLPVTLRRFKTSASSSIIAGISEAEPRIVYPPEGAQVELGKNSKQEYLPLVMKLQNGRPPFRWLANGRLFSPGTRKRIATWVPDGTGYSKLTVIDAVGRASSVNVYISKIE